MQTVEVTWKRAISIWWLLAWRTGVLAWLIWIAFSIILISAVVVNENNYPTAVLLIGVGKITIGLFSSLVVFRSVFKKYFHDFSVIILTDDDSINYADAITFKRVFAAWWLFTWRIWLACLPLTIGLNLIERAGVSKPVYILSALIALALGIWISLRTIQALFNKKFSDFRLVMKHESEGPVLKQPKPAEPEGEYAKIINKIP